MKKTVNCYVDGDYLCDVLAFALRNDLMLPEAKRELMEKYTGHKVAFVVETMKSEGIKK